MGARRHHLRDHPGLTIEPLLTARALTVTDREGRTLVGPLDLSVARGERVGVFGASGSGKTLTASAVAGRLPSGLRSGGTAEVRGRTGLLAQDSYAALEPLVSVGRQLALPSPADRATSLRARRAEVVRLTREAGLTAAHLRRRPGALSGGERQRAALVLSLAAGPDLLVADEPTSALDVETQLDLLTVLQTTLDAHGTALLMVSHDLAAVARVCARTVVLDGGRIVEDASTPDLLSHPRSAAGRRLVVAAERLGVVG